MRRTKQGSKFAGFSRHRRLFLSKFHILPAFLLLRRLSYFSKAGAQVFFWKLPISLSHGLQTHWLDNIWRSQAPTTHLKLVTKTLHTVWSIPNTFSPGYPSLRRLSTYQYQSLSPAWWLVIGQYRHRFWVRKRSYHSCICVKVSSQRH